MTDLFTQISGSDEQGRGRKITEPEMDETLTYQVRVVDHSLFESKQGLGTVFVSEFIIVSESGKPLVEGQSKVREGERYSWVQFPSGQWAETAMGNIKAYGKALLRSGDEDPTPKDFKDIVENQHKDILMELEVSHVLTKGSKRDYFAHAWRPAQATATAAPELKQVVEAMVPTQAPAIPGPDEVPELTKEEWLVGKGPGTEHPQDPAYEYSPENLGWGVRPVTR